MLFQRLREETRDLHEQVENQLPVFQPAFGLHEYRRLLQRYLRFYTPVEVALSSLRTRGLSVFTDDRKKCHLLMRDLECLDSADESESSEPVTIPKLTTSAQGVGCMYVLEGSTLGGQVISRHLRQHLNITPDRGGAFFSSYGPDLGSRWNEFRSSIVADPAFASREDEIVASARETFRCFQACLDLMPK